MAMYSCCICFFVLFFVHYHSFKQGFWYFAEKNAKFRGIFRGKFAEKSSDFAGFSREKSQNSLTNRPISREKSQNSQKIGRFRGISVEKSQISKDFRGKFLKKSGPISREILGGNFAKKQSVKNSRFRWIFLANFAKIDQFCVDMTSVGERFF